MDSRYPVLFAQNNGMKRDEMKKPLLNSAYMSALRWPGECPAGGDWRNVPGSWAR